MTKARRNDESPSELGARAVVEARLGRPLQRMPATTGTPIVDYRTAEGDLAVEVKEVTSKDYREMGKAFSREVTLRADQRLTSRWEVFIERTDLSTELPTGPPAGTAEPSIRLKGLVDELVEHFAVLDRYGVQAMGHLPWPGPEPHTRAEVAAAIGAINERTHGSLCFRHDPIAGYDTTGCVELRLATSSVRTLNRDTIVDRLELWLPHPDNDNLRASLANEPAGTERHAFLVFDPLVEPQARSAAEVGLQFGPTRRLVLPEEIDVLWFLLGPLASRFDPENGWRTWPLTPAPSAP